MKRNYTGGITAALLLAAGSDVYGRDMRHRIELAQGPLRRICYGIYNLPSACVFASHRCSAGQPANFRHSTWLTHAKQEPTSEIK